jgi:flavin reductase (DIM6/NTAB) family NADH-FMN oxidoreductase RutF
MVFCPSMSNKLETELTAPVLEPAGSDVYRRVCGRFATGVTVVSVIDPGGRPHGITINSFASLSLDPPLVMVSIDLRNSALQHFLQSTHFAVNVLAHDQEHHSRRFARHAEDRFFGVNWQGAESGAPLIEGALAHLECSRMNWFEAGDHAVLIGRVVRAGCREGRPLLFFQSAYASLG